MIPETKAATLLARFTFPPGITGHVMSMRETLDRQAAVGISLQWRVIDSRAEHRPPSLFAPETGHVLIASVEGRHLRFDPYQPFPMWRPVVVGRTVAVPVWMLDDPEVFFQTVRGYVREMFLHEVDEWMLLDGHRIGDPHR